MVFQQLESVGAKLRKGQVTLVAAAPGGGKSGLLTNVALTARIPTLYFSADSDKMTFGIRVLTALLDIRTEEAELLLIQGDPEAVDAIDEHTSHIWVNFESAPTPQDIDDEIEAFAVVNGCYPELVVVDNLMDVSRGGLDERDAHDRILDFLKQLARRTEAAMVVLCHVTGAYTDGMEPIPRSGLMNKVDKRPRLILTLYHVGANIIGVCVVKNSNGPAESDGSLEVHIPVIWEKGWYGHG